MPTTTGPTSTLVAHPSALALATSSSTLFSTPQATCLQTMVLTYLTLPSSYAENMSTGINTRMGAELLIESCVFSGVEEAIESADSDTVGYATVNDVDLGDGTNTVDAGSLDSSSIPYEYSLLGSENVKSSVTSTAGQTLSF